MTTEQRPKVKYNQFEFYSSGGFRLTRLDMRQEIHGKPNPAYGKRPILPRWQHRKGMVPKTAYDCMRKGSNVGAVIPEDVLIIDCDTRKNGLWHLYNAVYDGYSKHPVNPDSPEEGEADSMAEALLGSIRPETAKGNTGDLPCPTENEFLKDDSEQAFSDLARFRIVDYMTSITFAVRTSDNGHHFYFKTPAGFRPVKKLQVKGVEDSGVDVLSYLQQVVTPGSVHPKTGEIYKAVGRDFIVELPKQLYGLFLEGYEDPFDSEHDRRAYVHPDAPKPHSLWGLLDREGDRGLEVLLSPLDPVEFRDYETQWFPLMCACHHAFAFAFGADHVFGRWSAQDPKYAHEAEDVVQKKWDTVLQSKTNGRTVATARSLVTHAERACKDLIRKGHTPKSVLRSKQPDAAVVFTGDFLQHNDEITIEDVISYCGEARKRIVKQEVTEIEDGDRLSKMLGWVSGLQPGWEQARPDIKNKIVYEASKFPESCWPDIAAATAKVSTYQLSAAKVEKQIRESRKKIEREANQESYKLTHAEAVESISLASINRLTNNHYSSYKEIKDMLCPPNKQFYMYRGGVWRVTPYHTVDSLCYDVATEIVDITKASAKPLTDYASKAVQTVSKMTATASEALYNRKELPSCVNLNNGTLWFSSSGEIEFKDHDRDDFLTTQLPYSYDPTATCSDFETMLTQVFDHVKRDYSEAERDDLIRHFWELIGYMIQPKKDLPRILIWIGSGQNGKSKISEIISMLVGPKAWLSERMKNFFSPGQPHNTSSLENKLVFVDDDVSTKTVLDDGALKNVCQSKSFEVNPKNRDRYQIYLQLIPLIITNNRLRLEDTSKGAYRRLDVIEWNTDISHLQDSPLPDRVVAEQMPGVLNKAAQGLARLRRRGHFATPKCVLDWRANFMIESNSVFSFLGHAATMQVPGAVGSTGDLFTAYSQFMANENRGKATQKDDFIDAARRWGIKSMTRQTYRDWVIVSDD